MEQHAVPQHISSYEFRLIGDMTLKQFLQLAGGVVIALIFYSSSLSWFLKWPLVILFALLGIGLAFLPIEERPLETWFVAFFKAVYSPTQFLWHKSPRKPEFLEGIASDAPLLEAPKIPPQDRNKLNEFISTIPKDKNPIDQKEEDSLVQIRNLFSLISLPSNFIPNVRPLLPSEGPAGIKVRKLHDLTSVDLKLKTPPAENIPPLQTIYTPQPVIPSLSRFTPPPPKKIWEQKSTLDVKFSANLPMPSSPTVPNVLAGMTLDKDGKIVEGVIMEIRDERGNPVRALRTNKLGQFRTVTPLPDGIYEIELEKEGYTFDLLKIQLKGEIILPIEVRAK